jgi:hypothetical protein
MVFGILLFLFAELSLARPPAEEGKNSIRLGRFLFSNRDNALCLSSPRNSIDVA